MVSGGGERSWEGKVMSRERGRRGDGKGVILGMKGGKVVWKGGFKEKGPNLYSIIKYEKCFTVVEHNPLDYEFL